MSLHNSSVFTNFCVKVPLNGANKQSCSTYFHSQCSPDKNKMKKKLCKKQNSLAKERENFHSLYSFYESIPDYKEINQLPEEEFYIKLKVLRRKQEQLTQKCFHAGYNKVDYQEDKIKIDEFQTIRNDYNKTATTPTIKYDPCADDISIKSWEKSYQTNTIKKCNSAMAITPGKSVRINSPKSCSSDLKDKLISHSFDYNDSKFICSDYKLPPYESEQSKSSNYFRSRSKSVSPVRNNTVPQPFKMTQRDDDDKSLEALITASRNLLTTETPKKENTNFKAHPIPITSKIPLYNQVLNDQEQRSQLAKLDSTIELQSKMKPFHFSERLERPNSRCLSRSLSSPHLLGADDTSSKNKKFTARPCPKNLLSNYVQHRMWEEEYFRKLNKKIRAEELMKMSSLPPSMAKRDKVQKKSKDNNRSESSCSLFSTNKKNKKRRKKRNVNNKKKDSEKDEDFITTCPDPFEFETEKRCKSRKSIKSITPNSLVSSNTSILGQQNQSPSPIYPVNRPNLAATLRTEYSRQKMKNLVKEQEFVTKKVSKVNWGVKKTQAWQNLHYDPTHDEELALRLATRRAEQKLRQSEHDINMQLMRQRVRAAPLLLEGPTNWSPKLSQPHSCFTPNLSSASSATKSKNKKHSKRNNSKLSNYSLDDSKTSYKCCKNLKKKQDADIDDVDSTDVELL